MALLLFRNSIIAIKKMLATCHFSRSAFTIDTIRHLGDEFFGHLSPCQCRRVLTYALRRFTLLTGRRVFDIVGMKPRSVSAVRQSLDHRLRADDQFREKMELLRHALVRRACIVPVRDVLI
jgi:hypothetical protein